jgi:hypothetical protein
VRWANGAFETKCKGKRKVSFKAQLENLPAGNKENHKKKSVSPISCPLEYEIRIIEIRYRLYKKFLTITVREAEKTRTTLSSSMDLALSQLIHLKSHKFSFPSLQ